jgi:hypothetical protein
MRNGERSNRINLAYLSDGYQISQLPTYITHAGIINNTLFLETPFLQYKNYFNSYAIEIPSNESGAKHPGTASDEYTSGGQPVENPDNIFQSTFDYSSIHRLLVSLNTTAIYNTLARNLPDYTGIFIVANTNYYGGSGGAYSTVSTHAASAQIAIHEFGHLFGGLADEYWAGDMYAAEMPNMTMNNNPATVKWKNWIGTNGIGIYPYASSGTPANWYRPHEACKMQYLSFPFCSVCTERLIDVIHQKVNMIDTYTPSSTSITLSNTNPVDFSIAAIQTNPSTLNIKWYLNQSSTPFATNQYLVTVPYSSFSTGTNTIRAEVIDETGLSRSYLPGIGYINNLTWTITKPAAALPVHLLSFTGRISNNAVLLKWDIDSPDDLETFEIEKSNDGINFTRISSLPGEPFKTSYSYTDKELIKPHSYYRIKIIEKSSFSYSNIVSLQKAFDKFYYKVYQNADIHRYHLTVGIAEPEKVSFYVSDMQGRTVLKKDFGKVDKQLDYDFDLTGKPAGIYFMTLQFKHYTYTIQLIAR